MWYGFELSRSNVEVEYVHGIDEMEHHNGEYPSKYRQYINTRVL
jgi:hypothetical protein